MHADCMHTYCLLDLLALLAYHLHAHILREQGGAAKRKRSAYEAPDEPVPPTLLKSLVKEKVKSRLGAPQWHLS